jgi:conjugal transfer pilus assembly protein TraK
LAVEKGGSDAWIKFLVKQIDDAGQVTRSYVTQPSEFFITCNGATYPLYAEPADIPAQTVCWRREPGNGPKPIVTCSPAGRRRSRSLDHHGDAGNRIPASFPRSRHPMPSFGSPGFRR